MGQAIPTRTPMPEATMMDMVVDTAAVADMALDMVDMEDTVVDTVGTVVDMVATGVVTVDMVAIMVDMAAVVTVGMVVVMVAMEGMEACKEVDTVGYMDVGRTGLGMQHLGQVMVMVAHRAASRVRGMDPQETHKDLPVLPVCTNQPCAHCILSSIFSDGYPTSWTKTP